MSHLFNAYFVLYQPKKRLFQEDIVSSEIFINNFHTYKIAHDCSRPEWSRSNLIFFCKVSAQGLIRNKLGAQNLLAFRSELLCELIRPQTYVSSVPCWWYRARFCVIHHCPLSSLHLHRVSSPFLH